MPIEHVVGRILYVVVNSEPRTMSHKDKNREKEEDERARSKEVKKYRISKEMVKARPKTKGVRKL